MPGLIAFRRRWGTGSDDLVLPGLLLFFLHLSLFVTIAILIATSNDLDYLTRFNLHSLEDMIQRNETLIGKVKCAIEIRNFSLGYLVLVAVASVLEMVLTCYSMKGTVLDARPRRPVEYIFYIRIGFGFLEMGFSVWSTVMIAKHWNSCEVVRELHNMIIGIVAINVIVFIIVLLVVFCVFDPAGAEYYKASTACDRENMSASRIERIRSEFYEKSRKTWLNRLSNCCCCVSNNQANVKQVTLDEVSTILHNFFKNHDFVPSDIVAGLTLLRHKQRCIENNTTNSEDNNVQEFMSGRPITPDTKFIDLSDQVAKKNCEELAYYCAYALAAYGPLFYWIENTGFGVCHILKECLCVKNPTFSSPCCMRHRVSRHRKALVRADSGCGWAHAGIRKSLIEHGVNTEIVYASFENEISQQPFYLSVDHERKSVIVTIRGTLGEADALTDMVAHTELIETAENDGTWKAHKGMLRGAEFIKNKLLHEDMVLSLGFGHCLAKGTRNYNLVIVGHSLGAGVASILAILLHSIYPNLQCYAFSPPGGLLSYSAMMASKEYIHTLIFGKDVVPRLGIQQLESLRDEVVELLQHTDLPKYKIILANLCGSVERRHGLVRSESLSPEAVQGSRMISSASSSVRENLTPISEPLYPPGIIYHLVYSTEIIPGCKSKEKRNYYFVHGDNTLDFNQIIVSHQMISHHLPQEVWKCLKAALSAGPINIPPSAYTQGATLPFTENGTNSGSKNKEDYEQHESYPGECTLPNTVLNKDSDSSSSRPSSSNFASMNTNQNNIVAAEIDGLVMSSSESSLSLLPDATAPLARPESFTLSSTDSTGSSAQSPTSPVSFNTIALPEQRDVVANEYGDSASDGLLTTAPQTPPIPFPRSKKSTTQSTKSVSFHGQHNEERDDSSLSCDDLTIDIHGTNAVG